MGNSGQRSARNGCPLGAPVSTPRSLRGQWPDFDRDVALGGSGMCPAHSCGLLVTSGHQPGFLEIAPPTFTRSGPNPSPRAAGRPLHCRPQSYLGVREPRSGGPTTRGSISEVQGSRNPGRRARWTIPALPAGRPRVLMQTPWTDSGLGKVISS